MLDKAGGFTNVISNVPEGTFQFFPKPDAISIVNWFAAWSVLGLGSIPSQDVFQRTMSSGSASVAVRSCFFAAFLYLTIAMLPLLISLCVKYAYPAEIAGDTQLTLLNMVLQHTAMPVQILFFGSLLSAIMSTTSSSMLAPAALFSENIVKPLTQHKVSDKQLLYTTRVSLVVFSAIATVLAGMNSDIYELVGMSSILSLVSLFIPLTFGLYWKRSNSMGALISIVSGMLVWFYFELFPVAIPSLVIGTLTSMVGMVVGSLLFQEKK
jgi:Na+/proline symporter